MRPKKNEIDHLVSATAWQHLPIKFTRSVVAKALLPIFLGCKDPYSWHCDSEHQISVSWIIICFCQHCLWPCELIANSRISPSQQGGGLFWRSSQGDSIRPNRTFACTWNWSSIFLWPPWELVWKGGGRDCSQMGPTHVQGGGKGRSEFYSKVSSLAPAIPERRPRDAQKSWHFFTSLITVCLSAARKGSCGGSKCLLQTFRTQIGHSLTDSGVRILPYSCIIIRCHCC